MSESSSPIRFLYDQIMSAFENGSIKIQTQLRNAYHFGKISPAIFIDPEYERLKTPSADLVKQEIQLQEAYLAYLWAICYLFIGVQEVIYNQVNTTQIVSLSDSPRVQQLLLALNWSNSMKFYYYGWPEGLPLPSDETEEVSFANSFFLHSIRYLMYHEVGHLLLHSDSVEFRKRLRSAGASNPEDRRRLRNMELQADDFAFDSLDLSTDPSPIKYMKELGGVMAYLSTLFLISNPGGTNGHYPDGDFRLKRYLHKFKHTEEPFITYTELTVSMGLQIFLTLRKVDYIHMLKTGLNYDTLDELIQDLFGIIDSHKLKDDN